MTPIENPYEKDVFVYQRSTKRAQPLQSRQYATVKTASAVIVELDSRIPEAGPFYFKREYTGNMKNEVLQGNIEDPEGEKLGRPAHPIDQVSIYRFGTYPAVAHNAGEIYNALTNGYTYPLDEFRAEAGL